MNAITTIHFKNVEPIPIVGGGQDNRWPMLQPGRLAGG
jgi:hypothetical protein